MLKPLLTPHGVNEKCDYLYGLPEEELLTEAQLMLSDLISWISDNFTTTQEQMTFLEGLSAEYILALSEQVHRAVIHRWAILFIANPPVKHKKSVRISKWVKSKENDEAGEGGGRSNAYHIGRLIIETGY